MKYDKIVLIVLYEWRPQSKKERKKDNNDCAKIKIQKTKTIFF